MIEKTTGTLHAFRAQCYSGIKLKSDEVGNGVVVGDTNENNGIYKTRKVSSSLLVRSHPPMTS